MSPSTRSKPASESSPPTGDAPEGTAGAGRTGSVEVELFVSRARTAGWAAFGILFGALLAWKLGTVAMWVGIVLMTVGGFRIWEVVQTFMHPPGTIIVTDTRVTLPRGLSLGKPLEVAPSDVTAVYFLRRSVPWNRSAPVLVIELGAQAIAYPRDWFASEADQRHVVHALMRGIVDEPTKPSGNVPTIDGDAMVQMIAGLVILIAGLVGALATRGGSSNLFPLFVVPIVAGTIVAWRGFSRW